MAKIAPPKPTKGIGAKFMIIPPQAEPSAIPVLNDTGFNAEAKVIASGFSLVAVFKKCNCAGEFCKYIITPMSKIFIKPKTK